MCSSDLAVCVLPRPAPWIAALLGVLAVLCAFDQSRWQPWVYQYAFMLGAVGLGLRRGAGPAAAEAGLNACRLIVASIYFWSGLQKANHSFVNSVFPWLLKPFVEVTNEHPLHYFAFAIPALEAAIGLALLLRPTRKLGVILALLMHIHIMLCIGPKGHNWNTIVWPWNFVMAALVVILFWHRDDVRAKNILAPGRSPYHVVVLLLFGLAPAASVWNGRWDAYLSAALYSGNTLRAQLDFSSEAWKGLEGRLPKDVREAAYETMDGYRLDLQPWSMGELNIPPYPAMRVFRAIGQAAYAQVGREPLDVVLIIEERPDWKTGRREITKYDCGPDFRVLEKAKGLAGRGAPALAQHGPMLASKLVQPVAYWSEPRKAIATPLSTKGSQIVDPHGTPVTLRGVNWSGFETETHVVHGLWRRDYKEMLRQIRELGYNTIRLPWSVEGIQSDKISGVDFTLGGNQALQNKSPLEAMDEIIAEAGRNDLLILLDCHGLRDGVISELWYDDRFSEADWIAAWELLARRYRDQPHVIGADLKNEPHDRASWGTDDAATDWRLAAERAAAAIQKVHPDWLIVVEGVQNNVPEQKVAGHWWAGNLEGVRRFPVRLPVANKLVYSMHEYGPSVYENAWFSAPDYPRNLHDRWEAGFFYIAREGIAPVLVGEFGGRDLDPASKEGIWWREFVAFLDREQLSFCYWCWNANTKDTGGLLRDDWTSIDEPRQKLLDGLLD